MARGAGSWARGWCWEVVTSEPAAPTPLPQGLPGQPRDDDLESGRAGTAVRPERPEHASTDRPNNPDGGRERELISDTGAETEPERPRLLLCGRYAVKPWKFMRVVLGTYVAFFTMYRVADIAYIAGVDAQPPPGLEHMYTDDAQRERAVSYIRRSIMCTFFQKAAVSVVTFLLVCSGGLRLLDVGLQRLLSLCASCGSRAIRRCFGEDWTWCKVCCSSRGCHCCCCQCSVTCWLELFRGIVYLELLEVLFFALEAPFKVWRYQINVDSGFANTLTLPSKDYFSQLLGGLPSLLGLSAFYGLCFLVCLKSKVGWLLLWLTVSAFQLIVVFDVGSLGSRSLDLQPFPNVSFAVGRAFPLLHSSGDEISANRIFFEDGDPLNFATGDKRRGKLRLSQEVAPDENDTSKNLSWWSIRTQDSITELAATERSSPGSGSAGLQAEGELENLAWLLQDRALPDARVDLRDGNRLHEEALALAQNRSVSLRGLYLVHGSHNDARANAFVSFAGSRRVVALYDTLFLGASAEEAQPTAEVASAAASTIGAVGVEVDEEEQEEEEATPALWPRAPTQAMTDDEVLGIVGHELGHAAMRHVEVGLATTVSLGLLRHAALGWFVRSPLLALGLSLPQPVLHVTLAFYERVAAVVLSGVLKPVTNAITRTKEYQADAYAAEMSVAHANALKSALEKLVLGANQDPDRPMFYTMLHNSHPTLAQRWSAIEDVKERIYGGEPAKDQAA